MALRQRCHKSISRNFSRPSTEEILVWKYLSEKKSCLSRGFAVRLKQKWGMKTPLFETKNIFVYTRVRKKSSLCTCDSLGIHWDARAVESKLPVTISFAQLDGLKVYKNFKYNGTIYIAILNILYDLFPKLSEIITYRWIGYCGGMVLLLVLCWYSVSMSTAFCIY